MIISNEKGKPYIIQGPPTKSPGYWDLDKIKYINFENYGKDIINLKTNVEIPQIKSKEEPPNIIVKPKIEKDVKIEMKNNKDVITIEGI